MTTGGPPAGTVGRVTRGPWTGYLVLFEKYTDAPPMWLLLWRDPTRSLEEPGGIGDIAGDRIVPSPDAATDILDELGIEWLAGLAGHDALQCYFSFPEPDRRRRRAPRGLTGRLGRWSARRGEQDC